MKHRNEKGFMLIATSFLIVVLTAFSAMTLFRSINEAKAVEREVDRLKTYCAAEAGLQGAFSEIAGTSYIGYINTSDYGPTDLYMNGEKVSDCHATKMLVSDNCVIVQSTGNGIYSTRSYEARIYLESLLSKYFLFTDSEDFATGQWAQYGTPLKDPVTGEDAVDANGRVRVAEDDYDRALMYFKGNWTIQGENVSLYGNAYAEGSLDINSNKSLDAHGDTYVAGEYIETGDLIVDDTWDDGEDKHPLTEDEREGELPTLDFTFYQNHNAIPSFGTAANARYIEFIVTAEGQNVVNEYNNSNYSNLIASYNIPDTCIIYVNGDAYVKGTINGRVCLVASDDVHIQGSLEYQDTGFADQGHSAAWLAWDKIYYNNPEMTICGIFYAHGISKSNPHHDAAYTTEGTYDPESKQYINVVGNRIMKGNTNLGHYAHRLYTWDPYLRKYPPPGLPVTAMVASVREI